MAAQENVSSKKKSNIQWVLQHDNDLFGSTDRYYTGGNFIGFHKRYDSGVYEKNPEQLSVFIEQEIYTPSKTDTEDIELLDRPFAGFLSLTGKWTKVFPQDLFSMKILLGVSGEPALASLFQRGFHEIIDNSSPIWVFQISDSFHGNMYVDYIKEWKLNTGPINMFLAVKPGVSVGTKDIYFENEFKFFVGKRNMLNESSAYQQLGELKNEFFAAIKVNYRNVRHDASLQGNLFKDNSPFTVTPKKHVLFFGIDLNARVGRFDFKFGQTYHTTKFEGSNAVHTYSSVLIARSF